MCGNNSTTCLRIIGKIGTGKNVQVHAENQKALEICGQWNVQREVRNNKDWRSGNWWEIGYVRKLELPDDADWKRVEAFLTNDSLLELKFPRKILKCDDPSKKACESSARNSDEA